MVPQHIALLGVLVLGLAGCSAASDDPNTWYNKTVMENFASRPPPPAYPDATASVPTGAAPSVPTGAMVTSNGRFVPVPEGELYRSDGSCGGLVLGGGRPAAVAPGEAIGLEMTECDVARRAGAPDKIELSVNERGERFLTMTYGSGERPRIYRFVSGRLVSMEALPRAARAPRDHLK